LRSPEAFLASRIFCFWPIDAVRSLGEMRKVSAEVFGHFIGGAAVVFARRLDASFRTS
jgi:hypothetical protein